MPEFADEYQRAAMEKQRVGQPQQPAPGATHRCFRGAAAERFGLPSLALAARKTVADIAEDFNLGGRGHRSFAKRVRLSNPRPVRLKIEWTKPLLDLAGQLLYGY